MVLPFATPVIFLLLTLCPWVSLAQEEADAGAELTKAFSTLSSILEGTRAEGIRKSDCNWEATKATLKFLSKSGDDRFTNTWFPDDCSNRRIEVPKLQKFLAENGFFQNPGRVAFLNRQDFHTNIECSPQKKPYIWRAEGWGNQGSNDNFNKAFNVGNKLKVSLPKASYFIKLFCLIPDDKNKCSHTIYLFLRPLPHVEHPLRTFEDSPRTFACKLKIPTVETETNTATRTGPFSFEFRVPPTIIKDMNANATPKFEACKSDFNHNDGSDTKMRPFYISAGPDSDPILKETKIKLGKVENEDRKDKRKEDGIIVEIKDTKKVVHAGPYECLVIDKNGIPSTPNDGTLMHKRFHGKSNLHVRKRMFLFIPMIFCAAVMAVILLIWVIYRKNDYMEYDDGTPFSKATPAVAAEVEAEKKEEVEQTKA